MNKKSGFSLVELALGLAVMTILVLAVSVSAGIRDNARIQSASRSIQTLRSAAENFLSNGNLNYLNISITALQTANLLPTGFTPANSNPWGGSFTIAANAGDNTQVDISLTGVNPNAANRLSGFFSNSSSGTSYNSQQNLWMVTF